MMELCITFEAWTMCTVFVQSACDWCDLCGSPIMFNAFQSVDHMKSVAFVAWIFFSYLF
jgi:hypothetical protein